MDATRKNQVSLRGASSREISRDALLQKVSHERELRNYARRASSAALFIQRVWRRYHATKRVALELQGDWESMLSNSPPLMTKTWISRGLLRPFLFFIKCASIQRNKIQARDVECTQRCFFILMESFKSKDANKNFCSLAIGTTEERKIWNYQVKRLVFLCSYILAECDMSNSEDITALMSTAVHLMIVLSEVKGWRCISDKFQPDAIEAVNQIILYMGSDKSGLYKSMGRYISKLSGSSLSQGRNAAQPDDRFLITAGTITLALRPFQLVNLDVGASLPADMHAAVLQYCMFILSVPWLVQRVPPVLLPALRHRSIVEPCLKTLLISNERISAEYSLMDRSEDPSSAKTIPRIGWALSNIISLATESENGSGRLSDGVDCAVYIRVLNNLAQQLLSQIGNSGCLGRESPGLHGSEGSSTVPADSFDNRVKLRFGSVTFMDLLRPVCQQWHLLTLMNTMKRDASGSKSDTVLSKSILKDARPLQLLDIAYLYSRMIRIYSIMNFTVGPLPVLNMLSFTPDFLVNFWAALESPLLFRNPQASVKKVKANQGSGAFEKKEKEKQPNKEASAKWVAALHKMTKKSQADHTDVLDRHDKDSYTMWNVESLRDGPQNISKDTSCMLHLFCSTYAHLLLVLDDIEFYEREVPFSLEQQRRIASVLNTLVYNGLLQNSGHQNRPLMDSAVKCLQMLYERDCRHQFCPPDLWLAPAANNRPPIATAARVHEVSSSRVDESVKVATMSSFITTTPYVYPFEERVQMFREFIKMDKSSRKMAGELIGPGERSIEVVIRRGHIVEDGFRQLNSLGSKLKSSIHVSFVSECGLQEAGLDYGGLSKEFLTDIAKAAFDPEYGLFCQTSTSEGLLIPTTAARFLENGIQMIEFLGRIVGKALYEGILLDYSFSHIFVQKLLGRYSFIDELSMLDPELYKNLMYLKSYDGDAKELSLDFTITEEIFGRRQIIDLKPGGKDTIVTNDNKLQYIHAIADYKLNRQILPLSNAFYRGLTDLISPSWLKLFNASEFNQLLSGGTHDIDADDLRRNTRYTGGYTEGSRTVKLFWEVMRGFEPKERCLVLKFVTSCSRAPLLGFEYLQPMFTIHKVPCDLPIWASIGGQDVERLPSASTCYNTLKLPTYKRASTLRAKLLYAINSNAGFELS